MKIHCSTCDDYVFTLCYNESRDECYSCMIAGKYPFFGSQTLDLQHSRNKLEHRSLPAALDHVKASGEPV